MRGIDGCWGSIRLPVWFADVEKKCSKLRCAATIVPYGSEGGWVGTAGGYEDDQDISLKLS